MPFVSVITPASRDTTFIYALSDPDTGLIRYIGKSDNPQDRYFHHLIDTKRTHKVNWLNLLKKQGKKPLLKIVEEIPVHCWEEKEKKWIAYYKGLGCNLTNSSDGGEGVQFTEEVRKKMSESKRGHIVTEETRKKISLKHLNPSIEYRKKLSDAHKGIPVSIGTLKNLRKMAEERKGLPLNEEIRKKLSIVNTGKKHNIITRKKLSNATTQYMSNPEIRKKQSDACKRQWADPEYRKKRSEDTKKLWMNPDYRKKTSDAHKKKVHL